MCCCSIKFTLKACSAISWIYVHKMLNGSQWSYISWSKIGTAMIWIFRQWEIDQLWTFMCCKLFIHFNASNLAMSELVSGTDNGKCLQKTFPIGKFIWSTRKHISNINQMIKERYCHANRAVIWLITTAVNCTAESLFSHIFISDFLWKWSASLYLHFIKNNSYIGCNQWHVKLLF